MTLKSYQSWPNLINQIQNEMNKVFDRNLNMNETDSSTIATSQWRPAVDIKEETNCFKLIADIPGVDPNNIEVSMENGILTIKGERAINKEEQGENYSRIERVSGMFYRRFSLPDSADSEKISAKGKHGVLEITIPKKEKNQPRKIDIKVEN